MLLIGYADKLTQPKIGLEMHWTQLKTFLDNAKSILSSFLLASWSIFDFVVNKIWKKITEVDVFFAFMRNNFTVKFLFTRLSNFVKKELTIPFADENGVSRISDGTYKILYICVHKCRQGGVGSLESRKSRRLLWTAPYQKVLLSLTLK